jgi:hypothetical protein
LAAIFNNAATSFSASVAMRSADSYLSKACAKSECDIKVPYFIEEKFIAGSIERIKKGGDGGVSVSFFYSLARFIEMMGILGTCVPAKRRLSAI